MTSLALQVQPYFQRHFDLYSEAVVHNCGVWWPEFSSGVFCPSSLSDALSSLSHFIQLDLWSLALLLQHGGWA